MAYDPHNIFARILRGEIPSAPVYQDEFAYAINDIAPSAPTHILVLPRGQYSSFADFMANASEAEITGFFKAVATVAEKFNAAPDFRLITNNGAAAGQSVFHFHVHVLAGKPMGPLLAD
jgi:histidine triad (HIT) family protein